MDLAAARADPGGGMLGEPGDDLAGGAVLCSVVRGGDGRVHRRGEGPALGPVDDDLDEAQGVVVLAEPALREAGEDVVAGDPPLVGVPPPRMQLPKINKEAHKTLDLVRAYHAPYWECMRPGIINVPEVENNEGKRLFDILRTYQMVNFADKFDMYPLYIQREALFRTYENQVLVTRSIETARNVLVVLHALL